MQTKNQGKRRVLLGAMAGLLVIMMLSTASARVTLYRIDFNGDGDCSDGGRDVGDLAHVGGESTYVNTPAGNNDPPCAV